MPRTVEPKFLEAIWEALKEPQQLPTVRGEAARIAAFVEEGWVSSVDPGDLA